ncbi:MAG: nodulation protein NodH, partial [Deltaproteobacteria bacterium]
MSKFRAVVVLATMRTGSNFLESNLAQFAALSCHGELFNPAFIGKKNASELMGFDIDARDKDPMAFLEAVVAQDQGLPLFRLFFGHDPRVIDAVLKDPTIGKIILRRDLAESFLSLTHARKTGQWWTGSYTKTRTATVNFDRAQFDIWRDEVVGYYDMLSHRLRASGQVPFTIKYSELHDIDLLNGIAKFLEISDEISKVSTETKKQIADAPQDVIENWSEVSDLFSDAD